MTRHGLVAAALLLAWTLTFETVVPNGDGTRTVTVTARDETGAVIETRAFTVPTTMSKEAFANTARHYFHQRKYPRPNTPPVTPGGTLTVP